MDESDIVKARSLKKEMTTESKILENTRLLEAYIVINFRTREIS
jgi:hypothetical protein